MRPLLMLLMLTACASAPEYHELGEQIPVQRVSSREKAGLRAAVGHRVWQVYQTLEEVPPAIAAHLRPGLVDWEAGDSLAVYAYKPRPSFDVSVEATAQVYNGQTQLFVDVTDAPRLGLREQATHALLFAKRKGTYLFVGESY